MFHATTVRLSNLKLRRISRPWSDSWVYQHFPLPFLLKDGWFRFTAEITQKHVRKATYTVNLGFHGIITYPDSDDDDNNKQQKKSKKGGKGKNSKTRKMAL